MKFFEWVMLLAIVILVWALVSRADGSTQLWLYDNDVGIVDVEWSQNNVDWFTLTDVSPDPVYPDASYFTGLNTPNSDYVFLSLNDVLFDIPPLPRNVDWGIQIDLTGYPNVIEYYQGSDLTGYQMPQNGFVTSIKPEPASAFLVGVGLFSCLMVRNRK